jgi:TRAP-type C4-dicarboxylate transport system permease small subunit
MTTPPPTPPQFPSEGGAYPEPSQATTALVLGILGIVICGILAPFAWNIGNKELAAIDAGRRAPENRGTANAGRILGIVGTVLLAIGIVFLILAIAGAFTFSVFDQLN